jgi:catechol 2,3-dioxygenase-like lactoylglutathione lyase family enzyme
LPHRPQHHPTVYVPKGTVEKGWLAMIGKSAVCIWTLAILLAGTAAHAQTPAISGIAHIAFRVSDLDKEVAFFGQLGYEESFATRNGPKALEVFIKINDRQFIELYPQENPSQQLGWMHVCFESDALNSLDSLYASKGLQPTNVAKAAAGNLIFSLKDPEGRTTEFTQYMPGSRHTLDRGQHLGSDRVSNQLMGYELPVTDLAAARKFYVALGFEAQDADNRVLMTAPGVPDLRIEIHTANAGNQAQTLFPVPDAHKAADDLHHAGLKVNRQGKLVFVRDPDGNNFVLLETGL